jgi:hypothetical protein
VRPRALAGSRHRWLIAFGTPLFNLRNVAETFDSLRQLDKRAKRRDSRNPAANQIANLVLFKPGGPDIVHLLDAKRYAARCLIDLQDFGFDRVALLVNIGRTLDSSGPGDIADVDQAVEPFLDFQECAELGQVPDFSVDHRAHGILVRQLLPGISLGLFHAQ